MKKDILTVSRFLRELSKNQELKEVNIENNLDGVMALSSINEESINDLFEIVSDISGDVSKSQKVGTITAFIFYVSGEFQKYTAEIEARKNHAKNLGFYQDDTDEQIAEKMKKAENIYRFDSNLNSYYILAKNNLEPLKLTLYEALILLEQFLCEETNKSSHELLIYIEEDKPAFAEQVKESIKHANFYSFALDINNDVSNMYQSIERKKKEKKKK